MDSYTLVYDHQIHFPYYYSELQRCCGQTERQSFELVCPTLNMESQIFPGLFLYWYMEVVSAIRVAEVSFLDPHLNEWVPRFRFFIFAFKVCEPYFFSFRIAQPSMCGVTSPSCHIPYWYMEVVSAIRVAEVSFLDPHLNEWVPRFRFFIFAFKVCEPYFFSFRIAQPSMCGVTSPSCHMKV